MINFNSTVSIPTPYASQSGHWLFAQKVAGLGYLIFIELQMMKATMKATMFLDIIAHRLKSKVKLFMPFMPKVKCQEKLHFTPSRDSSYLYVVKFPVIHTLLNRLFKNLIPTFPVGSPLLLSQKLPRCCQLQGAAFPWIIKLKLQELERFLLPTALSILNIFTSISKEPKNLPLTTKVKNVIKKQWSTPNFIFFSSMIALSLTHPLYSRALGLTSKYRFNSSTHLMLKVVFAPIVSAVLSQTAVDYPNFAFLLNSVYTFTDGIFIAHTAGYSHTALESLAGFAWGIGIIETSSLLTHHTYAYLRRPKKKSLA